MPSALVQSLYSVHECQKRVEEVKVVLEEKGFDTMMLRVGTISHFGVGDSSVGGYFIHIMLNYKNARKVEEF